MKKFLTNGNTDIALLFLRIVVGSFMMIGYGWGNLSTFGERFHAFADPFGFGMEITFSFAVLAEFFCAGLIIIGLFTRIAVVPIMITMLTAAFIIHAEDPWGKKEFALLYFIPFCTIFLSGPGRFSLDYKLFKNG